MRCAVQLEGAELELQTAADDAKLRAVQMEIAQLEITRLSHV